MQYLELTWGNPLECMYDGTFEGKADVALDGALDGDSLGAPAGEAEGDAVGNTLVACVGIWEGWGKDVRLALCR